MVASRENFPLLAELLADQQRLDTPVARFSAAHEAALLGAKAPAPQLIPLSQPQPGEQYAFEVDLDACTGCKSCVAACHSLNGLDETETWRDVGLLVSPSRAHPFAQTVTSACHHCADPGCLNGCPVLAYEKDPLTGIVRHLDDQCIGCSYCILKCPYDVPKFSARLGIVRKCDLCHDRLAHGEAPACAQACPTHAIKVTVVAVAAPRNRIADTASPAPAPPQVAAGAAVGATRGPVAGFLPAAPDPSYTRPTTRYITRRRLPENLIAGDATTLRPQPPHWPLVAMLTLMPVAIGFSVAAALEQAGIARGGGAFASFAPPPPALAAALCGAGGLAASVFHLGQPRRAWRIFLGWRRSWLSREAMLFGAWFACAAAALLRPELRIASAAIGLLALACSAMIYVDTRRRFWRATQTFPRFFGTAALVVLVLAAPKIAAFAVLAKLAVEARTFFDGSTAARLQRGPLARAVLRRDALAFATAFSLLFPLPMLSFLLLGAGELAERHLFFRAVDAPKMPGMPAA
jgi:Fe-S-cluster-containing dehydrogenase component/DMSO reductase anchor subunit